MAKKISLLFLVVLIVFSPITHVFAQENDNNQASSQIDNESEGVDLTESEDDEQVEEEERKEDEGEEVDESETESESGEAIENNDMEDKEAEDQLDKEEKDSTEEGEDETPANSVDESESVEEEQVKDEHISLFSVTTSTLHFGVRDSRVITLKKDLATIGFPVPGNGTNYFGRDTESQVKAFQSYYGLTADGIVGSATFNKIDSIVNSPLRYGQWHDDTVELKQKLSVVNLPVPGNGTRYYGKGTEEKVKEFQANHNLIVNGIADEVTIAKLNELAIPELKYGVRHEDVVQLKKDLATLGFPVPGNGTTYYGAGTKGQVQQFQAYYGLPVDGIAGESTLEKVKSILSTPLQNGNRHNDTIQLKKDLAAIGFPVPGNGTSLYGSDTEKKVREFQVAHGLVENGIADEVTLAKIQDLQSPDLKRGIRHPDVIVLKEDLAKVGFPVPGNGTNYFGVDTEKMVKSFQSYYGLNNSGVADSNTLNKLDEVVNSPFQSGKRHPQTPKLKENLSVLGFPVPGDGTTYYGSGTEKKVKEFQRHHDLVVNGIADEVTLAKINSLLPQSNVLLRNGDRRPEVVILKQNLAKIGFPVPGNGTQLFGNDTEATVKDFQRYFGLGADGIVGPQSYAKITEVLTSPFQEGVSHSDTVQLKKDLAALGYAVPGNGTALYGKKTAEKIKQFQKDYNLAVSGIADEVTLSTISQLLSMSITDKQYDLSLNDALKIQQKASPQTDKNYDTYVSKQYINSQGIVTADVLNVRGGPGTSHWTVGTLQKGAKVTILGESNGWYKIEYTKNRQWVNASPDDILYYLDPSNFAYAGSQMFQFLDLSKSSNASAATLNNHLSGKGILAGKAASFIEAGNTHGINEIYLIAHSLLETGNGTSKLATGVKYKGQTVYNMYGIGAYDSCPLECGAKHAYEQGWTTPEKAIVGGAKFVGEGYIYNQVGQNTLYKMRWNPDAMESTGNFGKQYATDIGWASKQTSMLYQIYKSIDNYVLHLEIPVYK